MKMSYETEIFCGSVVDKRTREGQEYLVLEQIKKYGGFSIFWITENQKRAHAATRLDLRGVITVTPKQFPWSSAAINSINVRNGE